ncbi:MAG: twin-arginine translocation signal domain-containing protein [Arenicellales bacterium]|jgi:nitrous oxide reductase
MSKKQSPKEQNVSGRRAFLKGAAVAGGAAALASGQRAVAASDPVSGDASAGSGYQESGHIRDYYKTARL